MSSITTQCFACKKVFKTLYSLKKHLRQQHDDEVDSIVPVFKDSAGEIVNLPVARQSLESESQPGYKMWLSGLIERLNSTFHPRLPGRWVKIDSHQVPRKYFEYLVGKAGLKVNAVKDVAHKGQPGYKSATRKISYKIFDPESFFDALEETEVTFITEVLYCGNESCDESTSSVTPLTAEEEILRAKQRAHVPPQKRKRPSSKSTLVVGLGEGRSTREIELIWWPDLYPMSEHGQLVIRMFIEKCDF